jgi:hypothetical protein
VVESVLAAVVPAMAEAEVDVDGLVSVNEAVVVVTFVVLVEAVGQNTKVESDVAAAADDDDDDTRFDFVHQSYAIDLFDGNVDILVAAADSGRRCFRIEMDRWIPGDWRAAVRSAFRHRLSRVAPSFERASSAVLKSRTSLR